MATSGTIDRVLSSWLTMRIKWVVNSRDIAKNTSNITVTAQLISGNGRLSITSRDVVLTINGTAYTGSSNMSISANTTKSLFSKTVNVEHNTDGSKTVALVCNLYFNSTISGEWWGARELSGTATLNSIERKSTFTRSGTATMGYAQTITITRQSSSFTHTLKYTWAGKTETIATGIGASYTWTPPVSMASKILNATSGSCKLTLQTYSGSTLIGTTTLTFTLSVPTKSTFTRSGTASIGSKQTITIARKSDVYTHKLYCTWDGTKTTIATNITTSYEWTPPAEMAKKIPNSTSGTCALTLETYNGTALVGSTMLTFTLSVPTTPDFMPSISAFTLAEAVSGLAEQFVGFVNTKSKIKYTVTAAGAQGSTINSYSISLADQKFTSKTGTTAAISCGAGKKTATVTVTDSRGRIATTTAIFIVYEYTPPSFKSIYVKRCDANGTEDDNGTCMKFCVSVAVAAVNNKNTATYSLAYKFTTSSSYTALPLEASGYTYSETTVFESPVFSTENAYDVKFTVTDYFATVTSVVELPTSKPMIDYKANHKGIGIGKVAEVDNLLDIGYSTRFYGGITPIFIDKGTDFNTLIVPNLYASSVVAGDGTISNYTNCPIVAIQSFLLEVLPSGNNSAAILQRFTIASKEYGGTFERQYYSGTWGTWYRTFNKRGVSLWSGAYYMNASQEISLPEKISDQVTGIELIFCPYENGAKVADQYHQFFISKYSVITASGVGRKFFMSKLDMSVAAEKYLYISNDKITGHANNSLSTATTGATGITYTNRSFVLCDVIGV